MPLYAFDCGEHRADHIVRVGTSTVTCECGREASRVFDLTASKVEGRYASEYELPRAARDLLGEASLWKQRALHEKHEAEMNGFRA